MKWNSLPTSAIYAPICKQNFPGWLQQPQALQPTVAKEASFGAPYGALLRQPTRNLQVRYIHAGIGADSLFDLHNQILTLKETIMSLKPLVEKNDDIEDQLSTHDSSLTFDEMEISSTDYQKLQEEYNKLIFQKHKV